MEKMIYIDGLRQISEEYEGYIIDLWGVIHDGIAPYPGAVECLRQLSDLGKSVVLLSNAPRRAHVAQASLRNMGIPDHLYTGILTSGEATHQLLRERFQPEAHPFFNTLGPRVFHIGPDRDRNVIEGLDLIRVERPADADFVLNTGPDDLGSATDLDSWKPLLHDCVRLALPMVCANPDLEVLRGTTRLICAGALTQCYEELGGRAVWVGKPAGAVYDRVMAMLSVERSQVLAIGDSLRTDIAGAKSAGIASFWVLGGIHGEELGSSKERIEIAAAAAGVAPVACAWSLEW